MDTSRLVYYDGNILKGEISLRGTTIRQLTLSEADGRKFAFEISNIVGALNKSTLILAGSSEKEMMNWILAFQETIDKSRDIPPYESFSVSSIRIFMSLFNR